MKKVVSILVLTVIAGCSGEPAPEAIPNAEEAPAAPVQPLVVAAPDGGRNLADVIATWREESGARVTVVDVASPDRKDADLVIFDSVAAAWDEAESDELRPVYSETVRENIDVSLRDSESLWTALSTRARLVVYHEPSVSDEDLATLTGYASLGDERWQGRLCLSSSRHDANRMLVAFMIKQLGVRDAELAVRAWRANLATTVLADDDALLAAIASGDCVIGIADSHRIYAAPAASDLSVHWFAAPEATLFDASVGGVARHAQDPDGASELLDWLSTPTANALFAIRQLDFPANAASPMASTIASTIEDLPLTPGRVPASVSELAFLLEDADLLRERARYP